LISRAYQEMKEASGSEKMARELQDTKLMLSQSQSANQSLIKVTYTLHITNENTH